MLGTDAGDNAGVLTDGFCENRPSSDQLIVGIDAAMMLVSLRWRMLVSSTLVDGYQTQELTSSPMMNQGTTDESPTQPVLTILWKL